MLVRSAQHLQLGRCRPAAGHVRDEVRGDGGAALFQRGCRLGRVQQHDRGAAFGLSFPLGYSTPSPYFHRDLTLLVRDLGSSQIVFETRVTNDGVQNETPAVLSAMLDAALQGFPQPPPGPRRINIQIPR